jgi:hypothetical protein
MPNTWDSNSEPKFGTRPQASNMHAQTKRRAAGQRRRGAVAERALQVHFRAKVRRSVESTRTATIQSQLTIKATSHQRRKPSTGKRQSDIRGSTLARATTTTNSTARDACQGTDPPSRRPLTLLQGPSRGEEASKKLPAIGSVLSAKPRRLQGSRTKSGLQKCGARSHISPRAQ